MSKYVIDYVKNLKTDAENEAALVQSLKDKLDDPEVQKFIRDKQIGSERKALEHSSTFHNCIYKLKESGIDVDIISNLVNSAIMLERFRYGILLDTLVK